ncbi:MAG TPA: potassium channel protein [Thermodesulfovibrionales bacterium]|nr:potassium channel protein [Thermodesulfovibrionales bacterium]
MALVVIFLAGTAGYRVIGGKGYSLLDCFYMTFITITTIGYGEIIDLSKNPPGRVFTIIVALSGIMTLTYILSNFTAFLVEGELKEVFRRRRMEKMIRKFKDHFIICGIEGTGFYIAKELRETERPYIIVDLDRKKIDRVLETSHEDLFVEGDATDSATLQKAGIAEAKGLFAVTDDDNQNLVISLTAKQLNPAIRVVARSQDLKNVEKIKKAGADTVVSPTYIGGLRMASEMIRPTVASFLDSMLRDKEKNLRIEEITVPHAFTGKPISALFLKKPLRILLLAMKTKDGLVYNPSPDHTMTEGDTLIFMTTPEERRNLARLFSP